MIVRKDGLTILRNGCSLASMVSMLPRPVFAERRSQFWQVAAAWLAETAIAWKRMRGLCLGRPVLDCKIVEISFLSGAAWGGAPPPRRDLGGGAGLSVATMLPLVASTSSVITAILALVSALISAAASAAAAAASTSAAAVFTAVVGFAAGVRWWLRDN